LAKPLRVAAIQSKPPSLARFNSRPSRNITDEFLQWVRDTGRPDAWRYHDNSPPPPDQEYEELVTFDIPTKHRPSVGMASCPICSPEKPKYFQGVLAWFPAEWTLRAIGHECAKNHFGASLASQARQKRLIKERTEAAENRLLEWLPKMAAIKEEATALAAHARHIDQLRQAIERAATKAACKALMLAGGGGFLVISELVKIDSVDVYGVSRSRSEGKVISRTPVSGLDFLKPPRILVEALANNTLGLLGAIEAKDEDDALSFIIDKLSDPSDLFKADALVTKAIDEVGNLRNAVETARLFLNPANLLALSGWTKDLRSGSPMQFDFDPKKPNMFRVRRKQGSWRTLPVPGGLSAVKDPGTVDQTSLPPHAIHKNRRPDTNA